MARFLILTFPVDGHVAPSIPIVQKLVERRHEVRWITGRTYEDRIKAIGAQFHPLPKEIDPEGKEIYDIFPQLNDLKGFAQIKWYINLRKQRPSAVEIRDAVKEVLANPVYRENSKRIQSDFAGHDAPTRAAELLESLASGELPQ